MTKPNCILFNFWENSPLSCYSYGCLYPMRWQISCYVDQSDDRGCSIALHNRQLIYFALSFIHLLASGPDKRPTLDYHDSFNLILVIEISRNIFICVHHCCRLLIAKSFCFFFFAWLHTFFMTLLDPASHIKQERPSARLYLCLPLMTIMKIYDYWGNVW